MVKNSLKRSGAKAMSYKKPRRSFKKFITIKKKYYYNQLKNKIRTLRSSSSKDYRKLLNKSTESRISSYKICLQTFMEHFKKLNSVVEADDLSNDDLSGAAEKFPAQPPTMNWITNSVIRNYVSWLPNLKITKLVGLIGIVMDFLRKLHRTWLLSWVIFSIWS